VRIIPEQQAAKDVIGLRAIQALFPGTDDEMHDPLGACYCYSREYLSRQIHTDDCFQVFMTCWCN
jgi:hypothetical protein